MMNQENEQTKQVASPKSDHQTFQSTPVVIRLNDCFKCQVQLTRCPIPFQQCRSIDLFMLKHEIKTETRPPRALSPEYPYNHGFSIKQEPE